LTRVGFEFETDSEVDVCCAVSEMTGLARGGLA
jgi:hypothetical protein